jgi:hypothetical protein
MLSDMGRPSPIVPSFQLGWRSIASIRGFVIFRENWKPILLRVKSSRFWYTKQVDNSYIQPRLAYTLRPLFEQLGVPWPKPAISGRNLGTSLSSIGILAWCIYLIFYPGAADRENARAMFDTGLKYEHGYGRGWQQDYAKARENYEEAAAKGNASAMHHLGALYANGHGVAQDYAKAREWYEKSAAKGEAIAMTNLGWLYDSGHGVAQEYAKAREWYGKAAAKGNARAMTNLGALYDSGHGVSQDYAKAREWYEKAAAKGYASAMTNLGTLYANGLGVAQDYVKAREWYEKAVDKGDAGAMAALEQLHIEEVAGAGHYAQALQLQEALAAKVEAGETKREGKPGEETAQALGGLTWRALFAKAFTKALTAADRAHALLPHNLMIESNRAHALMFLERGKESKAIYLAYKGKPMSQQDAKLWERVIAEDFAELRKAGLAHPMMAEIEKELGGSR